MFFSSKYPTTNKKRFGFGILCSIGLSLVSVVGIGSRGRVIDGGARVETVFKRLAAAGYPIHLGGIVIEALVVGPARNHATHKVLTFHGRLVLGILQDLGHLVLLLDERTRWRRKKRKKM